MKIDELFNKDPYSLDFKEKEIVFEKLIKDLFIFHYNNNTLYKNIIDSFGLDISYNVSYIDLPFLPVRIFKYLDLFSVSKDLIIKTMFSSGTTGQLVSKIYLDRETSFKQTKTLSRIVSSFLGNQRLPMLVIDCESTIKNRLNFSARTAGVLGFSMFGKNICFALNEDLSVNISKISDFLEKHKKETIFLFGFTSIIWQHFIQNLDLNKVNLDFSNSILIHGGGWKKLSNAGITNSFFKKKLFEMFKINKVVDYYGMVEQSGSIFMECEFGFLHASNFSNIFIRDSENFAILREGIVGLIHVISVLPSSYPGHSLLTEDEGILCSIDNCSCGRKGKYFKVIGRIQKAEIRGCSDAN